MRLVQQPASIQGPIKLPQNIELLLGMRSVTGLHLRPGTSEDPAPPMPDPLMLNGGRTGMRRFVYLYPSTFPFYQRFAILCRIEIAAFYWFRLFRRWPSSSDTRSAVRWQNVQRTDRHDNLLSGDVGCNLPEDEVASVRSRTARSVMI